LTLEFWIKGLGLLKRLSQASNDGYLQSLYSWMINQLFEQKRVDPLLFEYVSIQEQKKDQFQGMLVLLKYYLPDHHSLVEEASLKFPPPGSNRLQTISSVFCKLFSPSFVPIDKFHEIPLGSFLLPILQAFQKNLPGLLGEWMHWMNVAVGDYTPFPHTSVILNSVTNGFPHPYSDYDVVMICERIMNSFDDDRSNHSAKRKNEMKIKQKARLFLWGSLESLGTTGDNIRNSTCSYLSLISLYLKLIEVSSQSPEKQLVQYKTIVGELEHLIDQHPQVKIFVEENEIKEILQGRPWPFK
jgi:hypothetical protein